MIALALACVFGVLTIAFGIGCFVLGEMLRTARADEAARFDEERARYRAVIDDERKRHAGEIERMHAANAVVLERLAHTVQYGTPTPQPAVVKDEEPDAESRLLAGISNDMVTVGGRRIQAEYARLGQVVSLEECEAEARAMLHGVHPDIPPERLGLAALTDGPVPATEPG